MNNVVDNSCNGSCSELGMFRATCLPFLGSMFFKVVCFKHPHVVVDVCSLSGLVCIACYSCSLLMRYKLAMLQLSHAWVLVFE